MYSGNFKSDGRAKVAAFQRGRKPGATSNSSGGAPSQYSSYSSGGKSVLSDGARSSSRRLYDDARSNFSCPVDRSSYSNFSNVRSEQSVATSVASSIDRRSISSSSAISSSSGWEFNVGFDLVRWFYFDYERWKIVKRRSTGRREAIAEKATPNAQQSSRKHNSHKPTTKEHRHATKKRSTAKPLR